ncbi:hypothetical protein VCR4J5_1840001 [Vibrio crassostreae]|uniref:Uncharacterized protein n=1 Tax=Vibrio crassostreae TaxID=246167 RepID=A0ABP1WWY1_9VIBR|nr:hypothetical protein [Vibrio crassostreae]CDT29678.1 hypothetical protein VCR4J5_1840001 [Vibrio crassostreae]CDT52029.1 hypothetical protein VCRLGP8_40002 [Vibrio crassostreae]
MTTITIPEVFGDNSVKTVSLDYIDCLDGLNAIFDRIKTISSSVGNSDVFNEKERGWLELKEAVTQGEMLSKRLEEIR